MPKPKNPAPKPIKVPEENSKSIAVTAKDEAEAKKRIAELYLSPELQAARLTLAFNPKRSLDLVEVVGKLAEHARAANDGDLSRAEAMLVNQAHALQAMFANLAERAQTQVGIPQIQCLMGLALRAQSQCRATLQTLADVKFPKSATFIGQANLAHQQQVNNAMAPPQGPPTRAREAEPTSSNELLEDKRYDATTLRMDTATTRQASGDDPCVETVAAGDRTKNR
ncbi:MAG: hypothetical protein ACREVK_00735 [Gammaproteobacteria bacterium]